jgi:light-dependent protochlorophyllide reductase
VRTVIVTGASSGLGYECARVLAADARWHVVLACRDANRGAEAATRIGAATGGREAEVLPLDLASLASIRRFVRSLGSAERPPLHGLVCNAGLQLVTGGETTEDGFEATFGVNHLGHFLLTNLLLDRLARPARIVFVSSGTHDPAQRTGVPHPRYLGARALSRPGAFDEPAGKAGRRAYSTSKLCNVLCSYELSRLLEKAGESEAGAITVNAFDPGLMPGTGLARDYGTLAQLAWRWVLPALRLFAPNVHSARESGEALARLVLDPALEGLSGRYFEGRREIRSSDASYDLAAARDLWEVSVELSGLQPDERPQALPAR